MAPELDVDELTASFFERLELAVGTCLSNLQTGAALEEFEDILERGDEDEQMAWFRRQAPTYLGTAMQARDVLVDDLAHQARDEVLSEVVWPTCPHRDPVAQALWWRGVRPDGEERGALSLPELEEFERRETAALRETVLERVRWLVEDVCRRTGCPGRHG